MPINWEGAGGSTTKLDEIAYEATPGVLTTASEAWYEDPAGTLTKVYDTVPPRYARLHSFAKIPGGGWYITQDSNLANYFDTSSRELIINQGWDPNTEGLDVVAEGLYHMSDTGSNLSGGRITGLPNRGPAGICVLPNGRLIWAASSGDTLAPDTTIFNQYTVSGGHATDHGRINFYFNDPNRNNWHHRIPGNELSQFYVHSVAAASNDTVYVSIGRMTSPLSTYRFSRPPTTTIPVSEITGIRRTSESVVVLDGVERPDIRVIATDINFSFGTQQGMLMDVGADDREWFTETAPINLGDEYATDRVEEFSQDGLNLDFNYGSGDITTLRYVDPDTGEVVTATNDSVVVRLKIKARTISQTGSQVVSVGTGRYQLNVVDTQFGGEQIVRFDLSREPAGISTYWFARTQEGSYRFPQVTGVTTDGTDVWFAGNFSGIVAGGFPRNGAGRWGIWKRLTTGLAREPDAFSPYGQNVWLQDLHYVSPTKIWVLCERPRVGPAADGSLNRAHFVTSYNPTTEEFYDDDDFTFDI